MNKIWLFVMGITFGLLAGCAQGMFSQPGITPTPSIEETLMYQTITPPPDQAPVAPTQTDQEAPMTESTSQPAPYDPALQSFVEQATEDLSQRLNIPAGQIELVEAKTVVWPDASLGCPQPGMRYIQVPVDGLLIRLRAEGNIYAYHSGGTQGLFLCEQTLQGSKPTPIELDRFITPPSP